MLDFAVAVASETALVFYEGSFYILIGFLIAGLLHVFLPTEAIARHLGRDDFRSVGLAALFGAPIPLCSCGVLPTAAALRRKGASRSSTLSFMISTPETGVDSIALTYGLLGPVMAIVRPVVAVLTAVVAGILSIGVEDDDEPAESADEILSAVHDHDHVHDDTCDAEHDALAPVPPSLGFAGTLREVIHHGFGTLLDELAFWIVIGFVLTGLLGALLPDGFFTTVLGWESGLLPMLAMVAVGTPLYLCASASTPVAAALIAKGLSPGAALVFLLAGPATNAATMAVVGRLLGGRRLKIYLGSIVVVSLAAGFALDAFGGDALRRTALSAGGASDSTLMQTLKTASAVMFAVLLASSLIRTRGREGIGDLKQQSKQLVQSVRDFEWRNLLSPPVLAGAAIVAVLSLIPKVTTVVGPGQHGIVQSFGRVTGENLEPGLYFHLPPPFGRGTAVDVDLIREAVVGFRGDTTGRRSGILEQAYYLTADENVIDVRAVVHYRVSDSRRFALGVENGEDIVRAAARQVLVQTIGRTAIDTLYTTDRLPTERAVKDLLREKIDAAGIGCEVVDVRLLDVHAPGDVHDAFRDIGSSLEDRAREVHVAKGYAVERTVGATGAAARSVSRAKGEATTTVERAHGESSAFAGLAGVHVESPSVTEFRLHMETLEKSLAAPVKYVNVAGRNGSEIDLWIGAGSAPASPFELPVSPRDDRRAKRK